MGEGNSSVMISAPLIDTIAIDVQRIISVLYLLSLIPLVLSFVAFVEFQQIIPIAFLWVIIHWGVLLLGLLASTFRVGWMILTFIVLAFFQTFYMAVTFTLLTAVVIYIEFSPYLFNITVMMWCAITLAVCFFLVWTALMLLVMGFSIKLRGEIKAEKQRRKRIVFEPLLPVGY